LAGAGKKEVAEMNYYFGQLIRMMRRRWLESFRRVLFGALRFSDYGCISSSWWWQGPLAAALA